MNKSDSTTTPVSEQTNWRDMDGPRMKVYQAINAIQRELSKTGIAKNRKNQQQGYQFRGIDDVYAAVSPLLAEHGLCILPRMLARNVVERETQRGGVLFYVTVEAEFDFVCAEDGSKHTVKTFGEAMDSGDKATNKAMSAAYKYAAFQAFAIPTEGDNDADATTHEVKPKRQKADPLPFGSVTPTTGAWDGVEPQRKEFVRRIGEGTIEMLEAGRLEEAYEYLYVENKDAGLLNNDELVAIWDMLKDRPRQRRHLKDLRDKRTKPVETA